MAAKKIVIASDLIANKELIDNGINGVLFKSGDSHNLSHTLGKLINQKVRINQKKIAEKVSLFDCKNTVNSYVSLYNEYTASTAKT